MPPDFVGLDPDSARSLGGLAASGATSAGHISTEVLGILDSAQIPDNGVERLCAEIGEELGLLDDLLEAKATQMELAAIGMHVDLGGDVLARLWASLTDDTGAGVDFGADPDDEDPEDVPLSSSVAAAMLAQYLGWLGGDDEVWYSDLMNMVDDESLPPEVRAAAQYFVLNVDVLDEVAMAGPARAEHFEQFVVVNAVLGTLAHSWDRFDVAGQDAGTDPDGTISTEDLEIVAGDTTGAYTVAQREAARWLLEKGRLDQWWADRTVLTHDLYSRRIFSEDPDLAVTWLQRAAQDPGAYVADYTWWESKGGRAWLDAALSSTNDPATQTDLLLGFAAIYQATAPEPITLLGFVHGLLDLASWIDPTQLADAINGGIYVLEGDALNAGLSFGGILLPIGGGQALRLGKEAFIGLATKQGDEVAEAALKQSIRSGELTDDVVDQLVEGLDDDVARAFRERIDQLRAAELPPAPTTSAIPGGGLAAHEGVGIGHTMARHIGHTDADLVNRVQAQPGVPGASTWTDLPTAERAISDLLATKQTEIQDWLSGAGQKLELDGTVDGVAGRYVAQGNTSAVDVSGFRVVLKRDPSTPDGYFILTSFTKP